MNHAGYFRILKFYSDAWARRHCRVILSGEENIAGSRERPRIYIISHPVTWDLPMLAHIAQNNFYVIADKGPFAHPLVNWLFHNAGFLKLEGDNADDVIKRAGVIVEAKRPVIISLYGYGTDFGEKVRPRTGGIRIAHATKADIYPLHLMIEEGKLIMKSFRRRRGEHYPFSVFHETLYFMTFCPPMRFEDWAQDGMTYEDYTKVAYSVEEKFHALEKTITADIGTGRYEDAPRRGGATRQVIF